jgi:hypothetical protein
MAVLELSDEDESPDEDELPDDEDVIELTHSLLPDTSR